MSETLGIITALLLTFALFTRIWRNNRLFHMAAHLLLGAWSAYIVVVLLRSVLWGMLLRPFLQAPAGHPEAIVALLLMLLLALRLSTREDVRDWGMVPLGLMAGGGSALIVAGALRGSLLPQLLVPAQIHYFPIEMLWWDAGAVVLATLATVGIILYFHKRDSEGPSAPVLDILALLGYYTLMIAFGALLAATAGARITLLIDRIQFVITMLRHLFGFS